MEINLLSEVTAHEDGRDADLLASLQPMHRLFVAVLALEAGRPVGMDRLTRQLWGDFAPADPRARLHTCAAKSRAALGTTRNGDAGADLLQATPAGYCLRVREQAVDVHRFRAKAAQTLVRARAGAHQDVAALAREALREWGPGPAQLHGPEPLAGLQGQWAANYRLTLRREHRDVVVELLEAELRGGGADRVLAEFANLADSDELAREDEQLTTTLMHAYYLSGRQAEALKTYQGTIESLRRKGVEAGRELRMMEKRIRNQDPSLDYPRAVVIPPRDLVPAGEGSGDEEGGDAATPAPGARGQESTGHRQENSADHRPVYAQRNIGRTVIANQGTQHVNLGGSDE